MCEIAMPESASRPLFNRPLLAGNTKIVLVFAFEDGNLCPLVEVTSSWSPRSPRVNFLFTSYDCSRPIKLQFIAEGDSWYVNFETRPYGLAILIAHSKITQVAHFVSVWKPWFATHLVLSVLVTAPRFNVMSYFAKARYAQSHNFLCTRLCRYMTAIVYSSFFSFISHG